MSISASLGTIISFALDIYLWLILGRVLLSWVNPDPYNPIVQFLASATEPVLGFFRRLIPPFGPLDLSPVWAMIGIQTLQRFFAALFNPLGDTSSALLSMAIQIIYLLHMLTTILLLVMVIRTGMNFYSWHLFRQRKRPIFNLQNPGIRFIFTVTESVLRPIRMWVPTYRGLDLTPVVGVGVLFLVLILMQDGVTLLVNQVPTLSP